MSEFEKLTSICAMTRRNAQLSKSLSIAPLTFSTPESVTTSASAKRHVRGPWINEFASSRCEASTRVRRVEAAGDRLRQNTAREVVDDRTHVRLGSVEQFDDRDIETSGFIRRFGAKTLLRFGQVQSQSRSSPSSFAYEVASGGRMREDSTDALHVQRKPSDGHLTMLRGLHHVTDRLDVVEDQALHGRASTAGPVVQHARMRRRN